MRTFAQKPKASQQPTSPKSTIPSRAHFGQSREANSIPHLQRTIGNQAVRRMLQTNAEELEEGLASTALPRFAYDFSQIPVHPRSQAIVHAKLTESLPGDISEQGADHTSEQIMRTPEPKLQRACPCGGGCPKCQMGQPGREHERRQPKRLQPDNPGQTAVPPIVDEVLATPGQPLDAATRAFMEPRFGHDFGRVRVHADTKASASAEAMDARAYTVGQHIVLGAGQPSPESLAGRLLLAHELAHVVQQSRGGPAPVLTPSAPHERDAHAAAMAVAAGLPRVRVAHGTGVGLARQTLDDIISVARDLVSEVLGRDERKLRDIDRGLRSIAKSRGRHAASAAALRRELTSEAALNRRLQEVRRAADRLINKSWDLKGPSRPGWALESDLSDVIRRGGPDAVAAQQMLNDWERLRRRKIGLKLERVWAQIRRRTLEREAARLAAAGPMAFQSGTIAASMVGEDVTSKTGQAAAKLEGGGAGAAVRSTTATSAGAKIESTVVTAAATEVEATTRLSRFKSGLAKFGSVALSALLPGPLDALALMAQFAGSYAAAHEAIRSRNTRTGFAIGLSAFLLGRSHGAVREHLSRRFVLDREVHTQVLGAVGVAEKAHNAGLDTGFNYGALLSDDAKDALRETGFSALRAQGRLPERQELFTAEGVWRLAGALLPAVDQIFEAMRAQAEKEREAERRQRYLERGTHGMKV